MVTAQPLLCLKILIQLTALQFICSRDVQDGLFLLEQPPDDHIPIPTA